MFQNFSSLTHTHKTFCILIQHFHLLHFYPLYMPTHSHSYNLMSNTQTKNDVIYLQYFNDIYLALTLIVVSSNLNPYELATTKVRGALHFNFILSNSDNCDFDVKVRRYVFVSFVNYVINCGCMRCVFCFIIKYKEKDTFYINFYSIIFLQSCFYFYFLFFYHYFSLLQLNNYNGYMCAIYNCCFFMVNLLLIKFYNNYAIYNTYTKFFKTILHKTLQYYLCISRVIY